MRIGCPTGLSTANNANQVYDGAVVTVGNGVTYANFVNGETNTVLSGALIYDGTTQGAVGNYIMLPAGLSEATATNYSVSYVGGTFTISQASTFVGASSSNNPSGFQDGVSFLATLPVYATGNVVFSSTNGPISTSTQSVTSGSVLNGAYSAAESLSGFNGSPTDGTWTLLFADLASGGGSPELISWSLGIMPVPEQVSVALAFFGIGLAGAGAIKSYRGPSRVK